MEAPLLKFQSSSKINVAQPAALQHVTEISIPTMFIRDYTEDVLTGNANGIP